MIEKLGPKGRAATISMDLVTHNQGKSISPVYEKVALSNSIRTSVLDYFVNNELHDKSRQWINVKLKNDPMAGEGKKREKFHTHRAGKLDQENLYTGAAHLYPPLNRSYPPRSELFFLKSNNVLKVNWYQSEPLTSEGRVMNRSFHFILNFEFPAFWLV